MPTVVRTQVDTVTEPTVDSSSSAGGKTPAKRTKWLAYGAVGLLAALVVTIAVLFATSSPAINSVAILPFVNDSQDPGTEYLSDGLTESIINSLSQLPNLRVMSRNAAFRFKGPNHDPLEAGRSLNVGAVLTGRLVKLGDRLVMVRVHRGELG